MGVGYIVKQDSYCNMLRMQRVFGICSSSTVSSVAPRARPASDHGWGVSEILRLSEQIREMIILSRNFGAVSNARNRAKSTVTCIESLSCGRKRGLEILRLEILSLCAEVTSLRRARLRAAVSPMRLYYIQCGVTARVQCNGQQTVTVEMCTQRAR